MMLPDTTRNWTPAPNDSYPHVGTEAVLLAAIEADRRAREASNARARGASLKEILAASASTRQTYAPECERGDEYDDNEEDDDDDDDDDDDEDDGDEEDEEDDEDIDGALLKIARFESAEQMSKEARSCRDEDDADMDDDGDDDGAVAEHQRQYIGKGKATVRAVR